MRVTRGGDIRSNFGQKYTIPDRHHDERRTDTDKRENRETLGRNLGKAKQKHNT